MCGLAELLFAMGAEVTGSDPADNDQVRRLKDLGIKIFSEHAARNLGDADVLVYSSAIKPDHVERKEARRRKIPLIPRAEALAELMRLKRGIAVAGTHGKTTTTSLLASTFLFAQQDPTVVVGGRLEILGSTAVLGRGPWFLAEADESDGSFSKLSPEVVVLTNIDNDHLDYFKNEENLKKAFYDFASQVPFYGWVLACGDDLGIREVLADFPKKVKFYGEGEENDYRLRRDREGFTISTRHEGEHKEIGHVKLHMPGSHNCLNALAALTVALECGLPFELAKKGIEEFAGVDRRVQFKGAVDGIDVYDDYGHHPTEVAAVLKGFKEAFSQRRLVVYFQPHKYSRTRDCWSDFLVCFENCDDLFITDIYEAGESVIAGIDSPTLANEVRHPSVCYLRQDEQVVEVLKKHLKSGDIFLTLGAGNGWKVGMDLLESYKS